MTQTAPEAQTTTTTDIVRAIEERSGVDLNAVSLPDHFMWFPPPATAEDRYPRSLMVAIGEPFPLSPTFTVMFLFQDEEEIRVYVGPNATAQKPELLRCYTLSKSAPISFCEKMPVEAFIQAVADEWVVKAEGQTSAEREREMVLEHIEAFKPDLGMTAAEAIDALHASIEAGDHLEEEPETPETTTAAVPTEPASVTPATPPGE